MDSMTPSVIGMTDRQIEKAVDVFRASLRKHRREFLSGATQHALGTNALGSALLATFRNHVEVFGSMLIRHVTIDPTRSPQDAIVAIGRSQHVDQNVVAMMPRGEGGKKTVFFVRRDSLTSDDEWVAYLDSLGLKPCDPITLAKVHEDDPAFATENPNSTHWKDVNGKWRYSAFYWWYGRCMRISSADDGWGWDIVGWWSACLRK